MCPDGFIANITAHPNHRLTIEIVRFAMEDYPYPVKVPDEIAEEMMTLNTTLKGFGIDAYFKYYTTNIITMNFIAENITGQSMQDLVSTLDVASRAG